MASKAGGRELPGRLSLSLPWEAVLPPALVAALVLVTRIPLRTHYLLNWDAVQFALGMARFDVVHHQPHPPGYLVYVAAGRALMPLFGDANSALVALSIAGECAGVVVAYFFAREVFGAWAGLAAALALTVAPLYWYYGEAANTYALEPAVVMLVAWPCWRLWRGQARAAVPAGLALALAGAIRPSAAVFLLPLLLIALRRAVSLRLAALSLGAAVVLTAAWLAPLLLLSGGVMPYLRASLQLGESVSGSTAIWSTGLKGLLTITGPAVARGVVWEVGAFGVLLGFGLLVAPRLVRTRPLPNGWIAFTLLWVLPALLTFLLVHIGQVVYVQLFLPALLLALGPAIRNTAAALGRPQLAPALLAACVAANVALFLLPDRYSLAAQLRLHDQRVAEMVRLIGANPPGRTVIVADANAVGAYRDAQMYLPAYHRVALAEDHRSGRLGEIYGDTYEPWRFEEGALQPSFPDGAQTFVFVDSVIVSEYVADPERLRMARLPDGARIYFWTGPPPQVRSGLIWLGRPYDAVRGMGA